jgi:large subunit ribosomal protein L23
MPKENIWSDNRHIIQKVFFTEKSVEAQDPDKKSVYWFQVDKKAAKPQIREAVKAAFNLKDEDIVSVRTLIRPGKVRKRRNRGPIGRTAERKKAVVTIRAGKTIEDLQRG